MTTAGVLVTPISSEVKRFGAEIRRRRQALDLSLADLAARVGLTSNFIGTIENGMRNPSISTVIALAGGLEAPPAELISEAHGLGPPGLEAARLFNAMSPVAQERFIDLLRLICIRHDEVAAAEEVAAAGMAEAAGEGAEAAGGGASPAEGAGEGNGMEGGVEGAESAREGGEEAVVGTAVEGGDGEAAEAASEGGGGAEIEAEAAVEGSEGEAVEAASESGKGEPVEGDGAAIAKGSADQGGVTEAELDGSARMPNETETETETETLNSPT